MANERRSRHARLHTQEHEDYVNQCMAEAPDMSAKQLRDKILAQFNIPVSETAVTRFRRRIGWTQQNTHYCQMIREPNKEKRVAFCTMLQDSQETFDVSFSLDVFIRSNILT